MNRKRIHLSWLRTSVSFCGLLLVCATTVSLSGCGSSKPIAVTVAAAASNVDGGDSTTLTATLQHDKKGLGVTWAVTGGGTLSNETKTSATYTAPAATSAAVTVTVRATSVANTQKSGTATIVVPAMPTMTTTSAQLAGQVGSAYSVQLQGSGGIPPYVNWALAATAGSSGRRAVSNSSGTLPPCVTLTSTGLLSSASAPTASCAGTYGNLIFTFSDSGTPTPLTATTSPMTLTITAAPAITFAAPSGSVPGAATYGAAYSGSVAATGGAGTLSYTLNGVLPAGLSLGPSSGIITGTPTAVGTFPFTVTASDGYGDSATSPTYSIIVAYGALAITPGAGSLPGGTVGAAYPEQTLTASGGSGTGYTWTVTGLPADGLDYTASGATVTISGTPTSAETVSFTASVEDSASNTAGPYSYTIVVGTNSGGNALKGTYVCVIRGFVDSSQVRVASLTSFQADGAGNITNGVYDTNRRDKSPDTGTLTGTYTIGTDGNGTASITSTSTVTSNQDTHTFALAASLSATPASQFSLLENDDTGDSPSGRHTMGNCSLATPSAFAASTLNGKSFAVETDGEDSTGAAKSSVGQVAFAASGMTVTGGAIDVALAGSTTLNSNTVTSGSFTAPDSGTGRTPLTITYTKSSQSQTKNFVVYLIDTNRALVMETDAIGTGEAGDLGVGDVRLQHQSSYSAANLNGGFVFYTQGLEFGTSGGTTPTGYYSIIYEGVAGSGKLNIEQSYMNENGTYSTGQGAGSATVTFDSTVPGRATISGGSGTILLYLFDTNSALELSGGGSEGTSVESGRIEPQTQTAFSSSPLPFPYMMTEMAPLEPNALDINGELTVGSDGSLQGQFTDGGQADYNFDKSIVGTYTWDVTSSGTFLAASPFGWSCAIINGTRFVCVDQTAMPPAMRIFQQ